MSEARLARRARLLPRCVRRAARRATQADAVGAVLLLDRRTAGAAFLQAGLPALLLLTTRLVASSRGLALLQVLRTLTARTGVVLLPAAGLHALLLLTALADPGAGLPRLTGLAGLAAFPPGTLPRLVLLAALRVLRRGVLGLVHRDLL